MGRAWKKIEAQWKKTKTKQKTHNAHRKEITQEEKPYQKIYRYERDFGHCPVAECCWVLLGPAVPQSSSPPTHSNKVAPFTALHTQGGIRGI